MFDSEQKNIEDATLKTTKFIGPSLVRVAIGLVCSALGLASIVGLQSLAAEAPQYSSATPTVPTAPTTVHTSLRQGVVPGDLRYGTIPASHVRGVTPGVRRGVIPGDLRAGITRAHLRLGVVRADHRRGVTPAHLAQNISSAAVRDGVSPAISATKR